ncbi:MAG: hypothetical protein A3F77_18070 [Betaproteobacteria bacterium RIFCSPLOWO2_12_FULL_67_28]|nr:MAG: hypothetical protein A3I65_07200 [Betaproteobacteria bacterium RIFCSPLOWO2_02_FULL_68_150]OGA59458.1 MAG: hypothetical protein A3F77_18070 [Betaproteobacteria bacterium RIFCSPLOWO2_12_FULL_67_28]
MAELITPDWPAPPGVRAVFTTRSFGDMREDGEGRARLRAVVPAEPRWLTQVHGAEVLDDASAAVPEPQADAAVTRRRGKPCAVLVADCLPVLFASRSGDAIGVAHAGWRGLAAGVIEATLAALALPASEVLAWLGPAIGARAYEVGAEVRAAFVARDPAAEDAFEPSRPGHWQLDLGAIARRRLAAHGVTQVCGGAYCTHRDAARFYSWRRDRAVARMAAVIWLT